jgi:hypothetical protein
MTLTTSTPGVHAHFADDAALETEMIQQDSVVPTAEPTTLPRPADLARVGTLGSQSLPSTGLPPAGTLQDDPEKGSLKDDAPAPDIYDKYTKRQKNAITAIVSFAALLAREWIL